MADAKEVIDLIKRKLNQGPYQDLSDVGNLIGMALAQAEVEKLTPDGNDFRGFLFGIEHGFDLVMSDPVMKYCRCKPGDGHSSYLRPGVVDGKCARCGLPLKPPPPPRPIGKTIKEGIANWCPKCGSSRIRKYWLFGKSRCIHPDCPNYGKYL